MRISIFVIALTSLCACIGTSDFKSDVLSVDNTTVNFNVITKSEKIGCVPQMEIRKHRNIPFFNEGFKLSETFEIKNLKKKVIGKYRTDIEVSIPDPGNFKILTVTYDVSDQKKHKIVDTAMLFTSSPHYFGLMSRFKAPDPELGFVEVGVFDEELVKPTSGRQ